MLVHGPLSTVAVRCGSEMDERRVEGLERDDVSSRHVSTDSLWTGTKKRCEEVVMSRKVSFTHISPT